MKIAQVSDITYVRSTTHYPLNHFGIFMMCFVHSQTKASPTLATVLAAFGVCIHIVTVVTGNVAISRQCLKRSNSKMKYYRKIRKQQVGECVNCGRDRINLKSEKNYIAPIQVFKVKVLCE